MDNLTLLNGDCLVLMNDIPDHSIDMIFTDLPYNMTHNSWDCKINLDKLWEQYKRIIKKNGCIALWAQAPFSHILAMSNLPWYKYEWIIEKTNATGQLNAKRMPLRAHENILVFADSEETPETIQIFYGKPPVYNPQMTEGNKPVNKYTKHTADGSNYSNTSSGRTGGGQTTRFPRDILTFKWDKQKLNLHPTQKPLDACKYFIKTYTNEGDIVLDSCMGSATTGKACKQLGRKFIGMELEKSIYEGAVERLRDT